MTLPGLADRLPYRCSPTRHKTCTSPLWSLLRTVLSILRAFFSCNSCMVVILPQEIGVDEPEEEETDEDLMNVSYVP